MPKINSRAKGANGELEVAAILQTVVNRVAIQCGYVAPTIRRNVEQCQVGGEDLLGLPWYSIEVKRCERVELDRWWEQTCVQARRKAPGANAWDVLVKGGWKRVGGGAVGTGQGLGSAGSPAEAQGGSAGLGRVQDVLRGYRATRAGNEGFPLPVWGVPGLDRSHGGPVVDEPRDSVDHARDLFRYVGDPMGKPVSSPLTTLDEAASCPTPSEDPNAEKQVPRAREPVLIWRQSRKPWRVRFVGNVACTNGLRLRSEIDLSLDVWLMVLEQDLGALLRG